MLIVECQGYRILKPSALTLVSVEPCYHTVIHSFFLQPDTCHLMTPHRSLVLSSVVVICESKENGNNTVVPIIIPLGNVRGEKLSLASAIK